MIIYFYQKIQHIGNKIQSAITYNNKLFAILNDWLYQLNKSIILPFNSKEIFKKYIFTEKMYSDIFCLEKTKPTLTFYNIELLQKIKNKLTNKNIRKIIKQCNKNIELLTYDILALLNIYKHFNEDSSAIKYLKNKGTLFDNKTYIYELYLNKKHIWLENYFEVLDILKD